MEMGIVKKIVTVALLLVSCHVEFSRAQEGYPEKRVEIILPHAAGGSHDFVSRVLAEKLREYMGQPFLVINKLGASGAIAVNTVATSNPDGYTIYGSAGVSSGYLHLINKNFRKSFKDFTPVAAYGSFPQVIIASKELPVRSLRSVSMTLRHRGA